MSTFLASQTGFPWSRDSASANSSSLSSMVSAILSSRDERCFGEVLDHLRNMYVCETCVHLCEKERKMNSTIASVYW